MGTTGSGKFDDYPNKKAVDSIQRGSGKNDTGEFCDKALGNVP